MIREAHRFPGAVIYEHQNYGYPTIGAERRIVPTILGVSHITGNSNLPSALAEIKYSARSGSGASFPFCVNRNGSIVQAFDPFRFAPWTNGDLRTPDTTNPFIRAMVGSPYNANEFCLVTIENVGYEPGHPLTDAQVRTNAEVYAWAAKVRGARRVELDVVIGHRMINSVTRWNCPTRGDLLTLRRRIVRRANEILNAESEEHMIVLPLEIFPPGTKAVFSGGTKYDLFRVVDGAVDRKVWTPQAERSLDTMGTVAVDGDVDHAGVLINAGDQEGWICSGWGETPRIVKPEPVDVAALERTIADQKAVIDRLRDRVATKRALGDQVVALGQEIAK